MTEKKIRNYYVDESGCLTLFDKKGKIIVGKNGVSKIFMIGLVYFDNPVEVENKLQEFRNNLLVDEKYKNIPSMQPSAGKTALYFHAKNDHPEIRKQVFQLLAHLNSKVLVVIRRKYELAKTAQALAYVTNNQSKIQNNDIYDDLVTRLFKNMLHKAEENKIIFARLGKSERRQALANAIRKAKSNFERQWQKGHDVPTTIEVAPSSQEIGLQVIDYYLWALQRLYEKNEDSFFTPLVNNYSMIMDLDDTRNNDYGEWYSRRNPLTLEKIKPLIS